MFMPRWTYLKFILNVLSEIWSGILDYKTFEIDTDNLMGQRKKGT